ncbi:MAG TPA: lysophospholipase [Tepidisphaeraceae bacterium]|jgi:alpha-beta hydrolase superfamily lysophospholipase|nr:lysophospholipase [Tepidisphaeraceae bacterium]
MSDEPLPILESQVQSPAGRLHCVALAPVGPARARLLIVHGYGEHGGRYSQFMRWLAARGIASEAIDLRGHGRSPGRRGFVVRWDEYLDDLQAFVDRDRGESDAAHSPLFVLGHSHGGLIVAIAGETEIFQKRGVRGCILASPYLGTRVVTPWYKRFVGTVANRFMPHLRVPTGLRPQWLTRDESMREQDLLDPLMNRIATPRWYFTTLAMQARSIDDAPAFTLPLLCLIGADDVVADPLTLANFFERAGSADKSHYVYPTCAHELFRERSREVVYADVLRWINARTPAPSSSSNRQGPAASSPRSSPE